MEQEAAGILPLIIGLGLYLFSAFCLVTIAKKTGHDARAWWGWIPIVNVFLMLQIAGKAWWWFFLMLIPFVGLVFLGLVWGGIAQARGKNPWLALLIFFPLANLGLVAYLAFSA